MNSYRYSDDVEQRLLISSHFRVANGVIRLSNWFFDHWNISTIIRTSFIPSIFIFLIISADNDDKF